MISPRIKICCIQNIEEAQATINQGTSAIGLVGKMPSGPGIISLEKIREISDFLPPYIDSFYLTSATDPEQIIKEYKQVQTTTIQIVDQLPLSAYAKIKTALPDVKLVQVVHVLGEKSVSEAIKVSSEVNAILLDSGNPNLKIKTLGGTGNVHDWTLSRRIVDTVNIPVYLAGGINAQNVVQAIESVRPYGIDLCSGVRTEGKLDENKLTAFFQACATPPHLD